MLYGQGYFRQDFDSEGRQQALYPVNDPGQLPIRPLRQPDGEWLRLQIQLPGSKIWLRCWQVSVGRAKLYLLDTNDFANTAAHRGITSELYGGDAEMRLKQEIVLGIGGWRLLRALVSRLRYATSTKVTQLSPCSNEPALIWRTIKCHSILP